MQHLIDTDVLNGLRERYSHIHPLIFHRSSERATSAGDLFDILDDFPDTYPVMWSEEQHSWVATDDLTQQKNFDISEIRGKNDS